MKRKLKDLGIYDRLHLEISISLSFCIIVVLLTLYLMFGYKGAVGLAPQYETNPNQEQRDKVVLIESVRGNPTSTKPREHQDGRTPTDSTITKPEENKNTNEPNKKTTSTSTMTDPNKNSITDTPTKPGNEENKPDPDNSVSLSFSLNETQNKYNYTFRIENTSKVSASLVLTTPTILKYNISVYNGGVVKSGTIGTVDNTALSIKPKEIYELNLDINNIISGFNEGVYLFEVIPTIPNYDKVKASVMFTITKTKA